LAVFIQNDLHTYRGYPSRIPQLPDLVGNELILLALKHSAISGIRDYVSLWFKMRSSVYMRLGMRRLALTEALKSLEFNNKNFRVYIYILLLPLPVSLLNRVFRYLGNS